MNPRAKGKPTQTYSILYEDLVGVLLQREKESKTLLEYAIETKTVKPEVLIKILNHQNENHKTFYESFRIILGDSFTDKYLKLYAAQIPPLASVYEEQGHLLHGTMRSSLKVLNLAKLSLELNSNSTLKILDTPTDSTGHSSNSSPSSPVKLTPVPSFSETAPPVLPNNSNNSSTNGNYYDVYDDDNDDEFAIETYEDPTMAGQKHSSYCHVTKDKNEINTYEDPELIGRGATQLRPINPEVSAPTIEAPTHGVESNPIAELEANETASLRELSNEERETSGFNLPTLHNEPIDRSVLTDFLEFFDEHQRNNIETLILSAKSKSGKELGYVFNSLYREFHSLKGSSRFCKLKLFEMITHHLEGLISDIQQKVTSFDKATRDQFEESLLLGMDLLWELKNLIHESKSEKSIERNRVFINKTHHLWIAVSKTRFNLRFSAT
jgi:hypothetical protein